MREGSYLFTSESVTEGHPDKVADQVSDAILDAMVSQDSDCRVAVETLVKTGICMVAGEVRNKSHVPVADVIRKTIRDIGYRSHEIGFDADTCGVIVAIEQQSDDIALGVDEGTGLFTELGAGDQGLMFGFACRETEELMPAPIQYAHKLTRRLAKVRHDKVLDFLRPDGKSQVTVEYENGKVKRFESIVLSSQHAPNVEHKQIVESLTEEVIKKVLPNELIDKKTRLLINPTGRFVTGGPLGDCGLTGRKIIVDTYGGYARHGGGAFSGKDATKVDRTACYMARYIAKNIVAADLAARCEIQLAYAIGVADPLSVYVETFGTGKKSETDLAVAIREVFPLKPRHMIEKLKLNRPVFRQTASDGHFGRRGDGFTWEETDMVDAIKGYFA